MKRSIASGPSTASRHRLVQALHKVKNTSYEGDVSIKWFEDGVTNVSYNCIDRHLKKRGDRVAFICRKATILRRRRRSPTRSFTSTSAGSPM